MWWQDDPNRLRKEAQLLKQNYPQVKFIRLRNFARYCTYCTGRSNGFIEHVAVFADLTTPLGNCYPIVVGYPCDFPNRIPSAWPRIELRPHPPMHQFQDGRLCLTEGEYDPSVTGSIVLSWTYGWLTCYDIWKKTGKFPPGNYGRHRV